MSIELETLRHSCAHLLAQAVKRIYSDKVQVTIGPVIQDGFYYDFYKQEPFTLSELELIEQEMHKIAKNNLDIKRIIWTRSEAIKYFESIGEFYKVEIINSINPSEEISLYQQGDFIDLCRGPHIQNTKHLRYFKLTKLSGAYWRGDSKGQMLQRIYGTAFQEKQDLENYIKRLAEAEKRDHRKLGKTLNFFHQQEEAVGDIFWHQKGALLFETIVDYIRKKLSINGYFEVRTPQLVSRSLWEKSGHWDKYKQNMFTSRIDEENVDLALKPMNCPCHVQIFNNDLVSYKQLPMRMAEFGKCHRYEPSGALHGLFRVRSFVQDDAHIFCTQGQIIDETKKFCKLLYEVYSDFGFNDIVIKFSTRPKERAGSDEVWDRAEKALSDAILHLGYQFEVNEGEGAFYGPKLEFQLKDSIGRYWQCGTLQLDFVLPERLDAFYIDESGKKQNPVILHRAILGSIERFIGILIENYAGSLPFWLTPVQAVVIGVNNEIDQDVKNATSRLEYLYKNKTGKTLRIESDLSTETVSYKIRKHSKQKIPYIITIGQKEIENNNLSIRILGSSNNNVFTYEEFINSIT
jgi:threonyl-tRNA synthetase